MCLEFLLQVGSSASEMPLHRPLADSHELSNYRRTEVLPVGEHDDGSLFHAQCLDGPEHLGANLWGIDEVRKRHPLLPCSAAAGGAVELGGSVEDAPVEVGAFLVNGRPAWRSETAEYGI